VEAETCKRELVIQVPPDVVQKESERIAGEYARKARIPGFRPGHVPRDLVLRRFHAEIQEEVAQTLLPKFFSDTVKEQNLLVVGNPSFRALKVEQQQPLTATATFEVYPTIELGSYTGLEVVEEQPSVSDEDVDRAVESLREAAATYEIEEGRGAEQGDLLSVSYEGRDARSPKNRLVEVKEGTVRLGATGTIGPFSDNLKGAMAGNAREFEVPYPADFPNKTVAGKRVKFQVEVHSVKRKVLPAVDDELARTVSNESTLEALRTSLRQQLLETRQREAEAASKRKLLDMLIDQQPFPIPETLVSQQLVGKMQQVARDLLHQGVDLEAVQMDWEKVKRDLRPSAERDVRGDLILEKIAKAEKIEVSESELDETIRQLAAGSEETPAGLKTRLTRDGGLARLQSGRLSQKALDFIYHSAKVVHQLRLA
jgi:trigger factor